MARPSKTRSPELTDGIALASVNHEALAAAGVAAAEHGKHLAVVDQQFGIDMPYDLNVFVAHAKRLVADTGMKMLELGLIFIQIREHEPAGEFHAALERIGIDARFAQKAMQVSRKFGGDVHRRQLASRMGVGKVLALLSEDESDLEQLAEGGLLAGYTADEFAQMTKAQVIAALRAERAEHAEEKSADEEIIRKKDERINRLSRRSTRSTTREQVGELMADLDRFKVEAATNLKQMHDTIKTIESMYVDAKEQTDEEVLRCIEDATAFGAMWATQLADLAGE